MSGFHINMNYESSPRHEGGFQELDIPTGHGRVIAYIADSAIGGMRWVLSKVEPEGECNGQALLAKLNKMFPDGGPVRRNEIRIRADFRYAVEDAVEALSKDTTN
jgi:hypothetical protein